MAFTGHGAIMVASVLNSGRAVEISVYVVRAFVQLRELLVDHRALAQKLAALEGRVSQHDHAQAEVIQAIRAPDGPAQAGQAAHRVHGRSG